MYPKAISQYQKCSKLQIASGSNIQNLEAEF